jgi:UDP-3-O-[3-hydroxymyristoyl] glucosamine N-acyltransferase
LNKPWKGTVLQEKNGMKLPMEMTLAQVAAVIGGRVQGPADLKVSSVAPSPMQASSNDLAFIFEKELLKRIDECKAAAIIVPEGTESDRPLILVERPTLAIQRMLSAAPSQRHYPPKGVHPTAIVDPSVELGAEVAIGPYVVIGPRTKIGAHTRIMASCVIGGDVVIGENCLLHPACLVADAVIIGNRVTLQQGANLGSDGFGYVTERPSNMELKIAGKTEGFSDSPNPLLKIPQLGTVVIEDDCEIGSCCTIDRGTLGATFIGAGSKIDNLVMVAHNCHIGREVIVVGQAAIGGSTKIGDRAVVAGNAGIKDHTTIGKDAIVSAMAGVMKDIPAHDVQVGVPAIPMREFFTQVAHIKRLPKMTSDMRALQKRVTELEKLLLEKSLSDGKK